MEPYSNHQMEEIYVATSLVVVTRAAHYPCEALRDYLLYLKTIRWYSLASETELKDIWEEMRKTLLVTDFVLDATTELQIHLQTNGLDDLVTIGERIGKAMDLLHPADKKNLVDQDFMVNQPETGYAAYFKTNIWLTFCYLVSRIELTSAMAAIIGGVPKEPKAE